MLVCFTIFVPFDFIRVNLTLKWLFKLSLSSLSRKTLIYSTPKLSFENALILALEGHDIARVSLRCDNTDFLQAPSR